MDYYNNDYLMHYGVKGMKWGKRKAKYEYTYAYGQKPKNAYQKVARSLGGTKLAKGAIKISGLSDAQKKNALKEQAILADEKAYNKAAKKAHKTGGQMTYDVATGKYSVNLTPEQQKAERRKTALKIGAAAAGTALAAYGAYKVNKYLNEKISDKYLQTGKSYVDKAFTAERYASDYMNMADKAKFYSDKALRDSAFSYFKNKADVTRKAADEVMKEGFDYINRSKQGTYSLGEKAKYVKDLYKKK